MESRPIAGDLEPKQQEAVDGPDGPLMQLFCCEVCNVRYFDTKHYFYGISSSKCLWCEKYGKVTKKVTKESIDPKS